MRHLGTLLLVLLGCIMHLIHAQPYQVNKEELPGCKTRMSLETTVLDVKRGVKGAPCTGILNYRIGSAQRRICAETYYFNKASAERLCYTLGLNMDRKPGSDKGVRLYSCDIYVEDNAIFPEERSDPINKVELNALYGQRCTQNVDIVDTKCFDSCYFGEGGSITADRPYVTYEYQCDEPDEPLWSVTCNDLDECTNGVLVDCDGPFEDSCTRRRACGGNTTCTNVVGSFECDCREGYKPASANALAPYDQEIGCNDINECADDEDLCGNGGMCQNTPGSYLCMCDRSHYWNEISKTCEASQCPRPQIDIYAKDPVYNGSPIEQALYVCKDGFKSPATADTYTNLCDEGKWQDNGPCIDVNECEPSQCDPNADCTNYPGHFFCQCNVGYVGDGFTCEKPDPCLTMEDFGLCQNGVCTVVDDMPSCRCDYNYEGIACDAIQIDPAVITGIVAIVLLVLLVLAVLLYLCCRRRPPVPLPPVLPGPVRPPFDPVYGALPPRPFGRFPPSPPNSKRLPLRF